MEQTLLRINTHWSGEKYAPLYHRHLVENLREKKDLPHIQVLTGIRRSGKTTIFRLMINDLIDHSVNPKEVLLLNLDEPVFTEIWNNPSGLYKVIETAEKLTGVKVKYLFLDEIQQIKDWELFAKGAYDTGRFHKIYVTGSNSDLLQQKFATLLSGRYFANTVRPFSLKELLDLHHFTDKYAMLQHKPELLRLIDRYLEWGSFPEIELSHAADNIKAELLGNYYQSIVLKDCIVYNQVRDSALFFRLLHYVLSNVGAPFFYNSLAKAVKSNENTVRNYLSFADKSYILADVSNFSFSLKEDARPQHKFYCIDNGLMNVVGFRFMPRSSILLENSVFNELVNAGYENIAFARQNTECDFIAQKDNRFHAFQVCYELTPENRDRELAGFNTLNNIHLSSKTLVTYDQEDRIGDVRVIPLWQMILD